MQVSRMLSLLDNTTTKFLFLLLLGLSSSCVDSKYERANKNFLKQYKPTVDQINSKREELRAVAMGKAPKSAKTSKEPREIFNLDNTETPKTAFIDTSKILMPEPPEEFLPDLQTLVQGRGKGLPEDMFIVSYNLQNFPDSYGRSRLSFDDIDVPNKDAFGISTELGEKNYQLVDHKTLQRDVDFTKKSITQEDREISSELISQEKQLKRKKYLEKKTDQKQIKEEEKEEKEEEIEEKKIKDTKKDETTKNLEIKAASQEEVDKEAAMSSANSGVNKDRLMEKSNYMIERELTRKALNVVTKLPTKSRLKKR